ncbi:MAG TPA: TonB-dependent receptor [Rubrivivax sp.]|nr:TonB-dependent receptor [Rubrivivax sp.]
MAWAITVLAFQAQAQTQTPTDPPNPTQTITVSATRTPVRASEVVSEITVLDRAAIERTEGRTLVEVLAQQAGLQFTNNGGRGKTSGLFIRGLESRHTLLLVDGVRVGSATTGTPSLDNLPLEAVERIEIVRGPMSSLYGSGAFGGVIQVFTRRGAQGFSANAKASVGSNRYGQLAAGVGFGSAGFDAAVQLQRTDSLGISATNANFPFGHDPDRDGFSQEAGSVRLGWQPLADWRLELLGLQSDGMTHIDDGAGVDSRARLRNQVGSLSARGRVLPGWHTRVSIGESSDAYTAVVSANASSLGTTRTRSRQLGWENTVSTPVGALLALVERIEERVSRAGQPYVVSQRDIDAVALGLSGSAGPHAWQASARRDRNSQFGSVSTGALAYGLTLTPSFRLGASYGTSHTLPSFNQLYFPAFGNALLIPEEGKHAELSLRWTAGEHSVRAAVYQHRYRNFISSGPQPPNLPQVEVDGSTLSYEGRWGPLDLSASLDSVDPRNTTAGSANNGKLLPRRAQRAARLGADWQAGPWSAGAALAAFSHRFENVANTTRLGGYGTLDLRAEWAFMPRWRLGLKLNNAGDKRYETAFGYNQPGREGFVTLRHSMR